MNIGMILESYYPEDIRITKEASALISSGYQVYLLCKRRQGEKEEETINGIHIFRIKAGTRLYTKALYDSINSIFWKYPIFYRSILKFIRNFSIDIIHVHDLPLSRSAIKAARIMNVKVVVDMHENYPAGLATWSTHKKNPIVKLKNMLLFNYKKWYENERKVVHSADHIIAVVDEMKHRLHKRHSISLSKITTVTNSEPTNFITNKKYKEEIIKDFNSKFIVLYIGGFGPHRGLDTAVKAVSYIKEKIPDFLLLLIGKGSIKAELVQLVIDKNLDEYVRFVDFQPFENVFTFMKRADINLIPHKKNEHTDHTIPHKLYQSLMVGKPTLVSDCDPLKRVISETSGAYIFKAENPESLSHKVIEIYSNSEEAKLFAEKGIKATIYGTHNWENDSKNLISLYNSLC
jgi:glycosyltransferase involved in cell wall biosynthesis